MSVAEPITPVAMPAGSERFYPKKACLDPDKGYEGPVLSRYQYRHIDG